MRVFFRNMTDTVKHEINVENEDLLEKYIDNLKEKFGFKENIRLIYKGRVLDHKDTFYKYNVHENDVIICMPYKSSSTTTSTATTATIAPTSASAPAASSGTVQPPPVARASPIRRAPPPRTSQNAAPATQTPRVDWATLNSGADNVNTQRLYNVEQIHAAIALLLPAIISNREMVDRINTNPNDIFNIIGTARFRTSLRGMLEAANMTLDILERGSALIVNTNLFSSEYVDPNAETNAEPVQSRSNRNLPLPTQQFSSTITGSAANQILGLLNSGTSTSANQILSMLGQGITNGNLSTFTIPITLPNTDQSALDDQDEDGEEEEEEEENEEESQTQQTQQTLTEEDRQNIQLLMDCASVTEERATQAYLSCGKNVNRAANQLI